MLESYLQAKQQELCSHNARLTHTDPAAALINGRHLTNVGTFRAYCVAYLRQHPKIHQDMTLLVRQLPTTETGLPLEIYVFTNDTAWANYEGIQGDIFDHLLAILPEFDLRVFQAPSGADLAALGNRATGADPIA